MTNANIKTTVINYCTCIELSGQVGKEEERGRVRKERERERERRMRSVGEESIHLDQMEALLGEPGLDTVFEQQLQPQDYRF